LLGDRLGAAGEDDEDSLGGIFGHLLVPQGFTAGGVDPGKMAADELGKRFLRAVIDISAQQGPVVGSLFDNQGFGVDRSTPLHAHGPSHRLRGHNNIRRGQGRAKKNRRSQKNDGWDRINITRLMVYTGFSLTQTQPWPVT
jgi:hypothetical protein